MHFFPDLKDKTTPTKVRIAMVQVAKGSTYDASLLPNTGGSMSGGGAGGMGGAGGTAAAGAAGSVSAAGSSGGAGLTGGGMGAAKLQAPAREAARRSQRPAGRARSGAAPARSAVTPALGPRLK